MKLFREVEIFGREIDFSLMESVLRKQRIDDEMPEKIRLKSPRIIYFAKDTKQNDVVVYIDENDNIEVDDYTDYIKKM